MTRRSLTVDAGIAVLMFALTVAMLGARGLGTPDPATRGDDGLSVLLAMASALPLVARRLAPLSVLAATGVASLLLLGLDYGLDFPFGAAVAAYAAAEAYGGDPRAARRRAAMLGTAGFVPAAAVVITIDGNFQVRDMVPGLLVWALLFAGAWIAADRTRLRRERIAELEERARRVEREAERERRVAVAEERIRIARELHDSAGHAINVILVQAGAARLLHERDPEGSQRAIATIEEIARSTVGDIDRLVRALRQDGDPEPAPPDPYAVEELVERHRAAGLQVTTQLDGSWRAVPRSVAWAAYRILQEALTNAARHGGGSAEVAVRFGVDPVEVTVTNPIPPGAPVDPAAPDRARRNGAVPGGGHGIVGMRERATLLGGTLEVDRDRHRFRLRARIPRTGAAAPS